VGEGGARAHAGHHLSNVSVVTIAWRNEQHAAAFADSLGAGADELIVVVNGPEGEAAAALLHGGDIVRLDANTGFSGGANAGVARATGDIVVVANLDLRFDERFFDVLRREAATATEWDLLAPRVHQRGRDEGVSRRTRSHRLAWVTPAPPTAQAVPGGNGACLILRRTTLDRRTTDVGGLFDPEYHSFNEDIDLFWWAERRGLVTRYVPDLEVTHALAGSFEGAHRFGDRPTDVQRRVMANYRLTVWKHAQGREWLGWPLGEAVYAGQAVVYGRAAGLRAYAASWPDSISAARSIRRRRGRLRTPVSRPE
jgi:GT2 family glycosyltransferase